MAGMSSTVAGRMSHSASLSSRPFFSPSLSMEPPLAVLSAYYVPNRKGRKSAPENGHLLEIEPE